MGIVVTPPLATYATSGEIVHSRLYALIAQIVVTAKGVDLIRGQLTEISYKLNHLINAAPQLITQSKHAERGMVTIPTDDVLALFVQECHEQRVFIVEATPER